MPTTGQQMEGVLSTALTMLELMASKMPAGADLRSVIEAECAAMRQASRTFRTLASSPSTLEVARGMREALEELANAADDVGVKFFDTDTMDPTVDAMQTATLKARAILITARAAGI